MLLLYPYNKETKHTFFQHYTPEGLKYRKKIAELDVKRSEITISRKRIK